MSQRWHVYADRASENLTESARIDHKWRLIHKWRMILGNPQRDCGMNIMCPKGVQKQQKKLLDMKGVSYVTEECWT